MRVLCGSPTRRGSEDGLGEKGLFFFPCGICVFEERVLFVSDYANSCIRRVTFNGEVTTVAGKHGSRGAADGFATESLLNEPRGICAGKSAVYVADYNNQMVRKLQVVEWKPSSHRDFPSDTRKQIRAVMMLSRRSGLIQSLPKDVLFIVFKCVASL